MAYTTGWYRNARGKRVYGRHSTSPGYYNSNGKWVMGVKPTSSRASSNAHNSFAGFIGTTSPNNSSRESKNANPVAHGLFRAESSRLRDGGPSAQAYANANDNASFKRQLNFNLDNDEDLAQGSQTEWSQPTSISNLISGQLRQANNAPIDAWETWAKNNGQPSVASYLANSQPMGAFGTSNVMDQFGMGSQDQQEQVEQGTFSGWGVDATGKVTFNNAQDEETFKLSNVYANTLARATTSNTTAIAKYKTDNGYLPAVARYYREEPNGYKPKAGETIEYVRSGVDGRLKHMVTTQPRAEGFTKEGATLELMNKAGATAYNSTYKSQYSNFFNSSSPANAYVMTSSGKMTSTHKPAYIKERDALAATDAAAAERQRLADEAAAAANAKRISDYENAVKARQDSANLNLQNYTTFGPPIQKDMLADDSYSSALYNPWGRMEGASLNRFGPSSNTLGQATMESLAMANAYFAPQRAELAYELGDMETDMRRLAVNLGRQIDDPVLQAKLYKEGMRATRTLDIQQNTFAFQLADSRRKEENQNFQFYDQLAQEEAKLKLANRQYYDSLDLAKNQYNLNNWSAANPVIAPLSSKQQEQTQGGLLATRKLT